MNINSDVLIQGFKQVWLDHWFIIQLMSFVKPELASRMIFGLVLRCIHAINFHETLTFLWFLTILGLQILKVNFMFSGFSHYCLKAFAAFSLLVLEENALYSARLGDKQWWSNQKYAFFSLEVCLVKC